MKLGLSLQFVGALMIIGVLVGCGAAYAVIYAGPLGVAGGGLVGGAVLIVIGAALNLSQRRALNGEK